MTHKITWGVLSAANMGHIEGFDGFIEKILYQNKRYAFMVSTPERTYLHLSESYPTRGEMESGAISYLLEKGELIESNKL